MELISLTSEVNLSPSKAIMPREGAKINSPLDYLLAAVEASISGHFPKFDTKLSPTHGVCWCADCLEEYRETRFTRFRNVCEHEPTPCEDVAYSELRVNQLQFILKYVDFMERALDLEIEHQLELFEIHDASTSTPDIVEYPLSHSLAGCYEL